MNFMFRLILGGTAIVSAETKENAFEKMKAMFGEDQFEFAK